MRSIVSAEPVMSIPFTSTRSGIFRVIANLLALGGVVVATLESLQCDYNESAKTTIGCVRHLVPDKPLSWFPPALLHRRSPVLAARLKVVAVVVHSAHAAAAHSAHATHPTHAAHSTAARHPRHRRR